MLADKQSERCESVTLQDIGESRGENKIYERCARFQRRLSAITSAARRRRRFGGATRISTYDHAQICNQATVHTCRIHVDQTSDIRPRLNGRKMELKKKVLTPILNLDASPGARKLVPCPPVAPLLFLSLYCVRSSNINFDIDTSKHCSASVSLNHINLQHANLQYGPSCTPSENCAAHRFCVRHTVYVKKSYISTWLV